MSDVIELKSKGKFEVMYSPKFGKDHPKLIQKLKMKEFETEFMDDDRAFILVDGDIVYQIIKDERPDEPA